MPRGRKNESGKNMAIIIALSSVTAFVVCMGFILLFLSKWRDGTFLNRQSHQQGFIPTDGKQSGMARYMMESQTFILYKSIKVTHISETI